jgi:nitrite reductase/ring-hydroxylating ferredoxin subunit
LSFTNSSINTRLREIKVGNDVYLVSRIGGKVYCVSGKCSHFGAPLVKGVESDGKVVCPWHGASFDLTTGAAVGAPAWNGV